MQKTLNEMAGYMINMLPPEILDNFEIDTRYLQIANEEDIRKGVRSFNDFMHRLYTRLVTEGEAFDKPKKETHEFSDNTNIPSSYPFVCNIAVFLTNIGLQGILNDDSDAILLDSIDSFTFENTISNAKIPDSRKIECLKFLIDCGIKIDGIDFSDKKPLSTHERLIITYTDDPYMLTGLKVMSVAQREVNSKYLHDVLLRCDYRVLANKNIDTLSLLKDLLNPLPADVQDFMLKLHQDYMEKGYKCDTYIGSSIRFEYFCKSKELWRFNLSLNNGHNITIKAKSTDKYPEIVEKLPEWLQRKIAKGYGCGKKMGVSATCDGGCRGYRIKLDSSVMEISDVVKAWIDKEVSVV